jgi:hypothetical protein
MLDPVAEGAEGVAGTVTTGGLVAVVDGLGAALDFAGEPDAFHGRGVVRDLGACRHHGPLWVDEAETGSAAPADLPAEPKNGNSLEGTQAKTRSATPMAATTRAYLGERNT